MAITTRAVRLGVGAVALALVAGACGSSSKKSASTTAAGGSSATTAAGAAADPLTIPGDGNVKCSGLKIAFFGALTGSAANLGINIEQGVKLAIDRFNAKNAGCQVSLEKEDSQGSADQAPQLAKQAIDDKAIVAIVGPAFSGESKVADPLFSDAGLPTITPSATNPNLAKNGWKTFHRALGNDASQGPGDAAYIQNTVKPKTVGVVDDKSEYGKGLADIVSQTLGSSVVVTDEITAGGTDFTDTVNKLKAKNPDAIFYGGYYAEAGILAKQIRDAGLKGVLVFGDGVLDPGFVKAAGTAAAEGAIMTCPCVPIDKIAAGTAFQTAYKKAFNQDPGTYSPEAFDAANFFLDAIAHGSTDRASINTYIGTNSWQGITKNMKFDATGEIDKSSIQIYASTVKSGQIVSVGLIK